MPPTSPIVGVDDVVGRHRKIRLIVRRRTRALRTTQRSARRRHRHRRRQCRRREAMIKDGN